MGDVDRGFQVVGLDASPSMLGRVGTDRLVPSSALRLVVGDLRNLPLPSERFDVVVCGLTLTHLQELGGAVAELARVVRPGGTLLITDVHPVAVATGGQAFFTAADGSRHMARNHVHWPGHYARAFDLAGLRIDRLEELFVEERFLRELVNDEIRSDARALLGLPLAIAWRVAKPRDRSAAS